ncbi:OLC1v1038990C1 [Oldenlandia corymbosa var. corymbosa]|uniref:OLC1v1038990C1 n=1 Tax=Oldenlandia corymbosa var. corymbosa TaxID=529605 RepID=A0AAV1D4S1_OLDCO|nr:OLC1v1038990C1 [Oldenlandia corymbosa var. corymbosa]
MEEADVEMAAAEDGALVELDDMKKRLKEMEDEAAALREMQAKVEKEMGQSSRFTPFSLSSW